MRRKVQRHLAEILFFLSLSPVATADISFRGHSLNTEDAKSLTSSSEESDYSDFKVGPRSELIDEEVESLQTIFRSSQALVPAYFDTKKLENDVLLHETKMLKTYLRDKLSFSEFAELAQRWNQRYRHSVSIGSRAEYLALLKTAFVENYGPHAPAKTIQDVEKSLQIERLHREKIIAESIASGNPDSNLKKIRESLARSSELEAKLSDLKTRRQLNKKN